MTSRPKDLFTAFGLALTFWSLLAFFSGLFNGGFLLWDDVVIADMYEKSKTVAPLDLFWQTFQRDLTIRFRPLSWAHYESMALMHGLHYNALLWHNLVIVSMASAILFITSRNLGAGMIRSWLLVAVTWIGNQGVSGFRLSLAEGIGMLFLSTCAWFLTTRKTWPAALCFILAALTKESFLLMAPVLILADMLLANTAGIRMYFRERWAFAFPVLLSAAVITAFIVYYVGTHSIGYAGLDKDTLYPSKLLLSFTRLIFIKGQGLALLPLAFGMAAYWPKLRESRRQVLWSMALCVLIAIPQIILFAKSGIFMHYLLPGLLWSALMVWMAWPNTLGINKGFHQAFQATVLVVLALNLFLMVRNARDVARWGRDARLAMTSVAERTSENDDILILGHPVLDYEKAADAAKFLGTELYHRSHVKILPVAGSEAPVTDLERIITERFNDAHRRASEEAKEMIANARCILCMPGAIPNLQQLYPGFSGFAGRDSLHIGPYVLYTASKP